ncbi:hypothetical protein Nizo1839_1299 [Lactiplantibacillus plantarum]|nr:hypothetical protein FD10_GL001524 [Lactiplantibacillus argentoratensis DSM 16365]KZT81501.1 hypothetical protein Nizo1839_1299 [Lactiplantibacillus plantarum]KZU14700.1 hypothetical protein Nizo2264_0896 [Lactiplantibacillus plantarum]
MGWSFWLPLGQTVARPMSAKPVVRFGQTQHWVHGRLRFSGQEQALYEIIE